MLKIHRVTPILIYISITLVPRPGIEGGRNRRRRKIINYLKFKFLLTAMGRPDLSTFRRNPQQGKGFPRTKTWRIN